MAFASVLSESTVAGNMRINIGTFTNAAGDTGGAIVTGLSHVLYFDYMTTSHVQAEEKKVTISGGDATIVTGDDVDGNWIAFGYGGG